MGMKLQFLSIPSPSWGKLKSSTTDVCFQNPREGEFTGSRLPLPLQNVIVFNYPFAIRFLSHCPCQVPGRPLR